jgi:hypothetical protein
MASFGVSKVLSKLKSLNLHQSLSISSSARRSQQQQTATLDNKDAAQMEWKKNVVCIPVQTTIEDLKNSHIPVKNGFYISHRLYVDELPEKYTVEPFKTKRTGGYDVETRETFQSKFSNLKCKTRNLF